MSLLEMVQYFYDFGSKFGYRLSIICQGGYQLDEMRNMLVDTALDYDQDFIIFLDTDMTFPRETLVKLICNIENNKKFGIEAVTGLYVRKKPPYAPHIYTVYDPKRRKFRMSAQFPMDKIFPVEGAGGGCLAVKKEVFQRIKRPYFKFKNDNKKEKMYKRKGFMPNLVGEDLYFCLKANPKLFCDPTILCKHYKEVGFDIDDYLKHNNIKGDRTGFSLTPEQLKNIAQEYEKSKTNG
jgi:hypothetical protein